VPRSYAFPKATTTAKRPGAWSVPLGQSKIKGTGELSSTEPAGGGISIWAAPSRSHPEGVAGSTLTSTPHPARTQPDSVRRRKIRTCGVRTRPVELFLTSTDTVGRRSPLRTWADAGRNLHSQSLVRHQAGRGYCFAEQLAAGSRTLGSAGSAQPYRGIRRPAPELSRLRGYCPCGGNR
jgi:hypothetical protein